MSHRYPSLEIRYRSIVYRADTDQIDLAGFLATANVQSQVVTPCRDSVPDTENKALSPKASGTFLPVSSLFGVPKNETV
jgi:hypothetical protein